MNTPKKAYERQVARLRNSGKWLQIRPERREYIRKGREQRIGLTPEEEMKARAPILASEPEKMVYGWLSQHNIPFKFQVDFFGGRSFDGGAVVDFQILGPDPQLLIRVQSYYHAGPMAQQFDDDQRSKLERLGYQVEDVWEDEVNTVEELDRTMTDLFLRRHRPNL